MGVKYLLRTILPGSSIIIAWVFQTLSVFGQMPEDHQLLLAPAKIKWTWGYINQKGEWYIKPQFSNALNFHEGLAEVVVYSKEKDKLITGFINKDNKIIFELPEFNFSYFSEGMLAFKEGDLYGFMDTAGNKIIPAQFKYCSNFDNNKAMVCFKSGKAGYINKSKQLLLSPRWDTAFNFNGKVAVTGKRNQQGIIHYGVIDEYGNTLIPFQYTWISRFRENKAFANKGGRLDNTLITGGQWYIVNLNNESMSDLPDTTLVADISENTSALMQFEKNVAWFPGWDNGEVKYGLIDTLGNWVTKPKYKIVNMIRENRVAVYNGKMGVIDTRGFMIVPYIYDLIGNFYNGLAWFKSGGKYGYINLKGEVVIEPIFDEARDFMKAGERFLK
jgi:hypothetical protein